MTILLFQSFSVTYPPLLASQDKNLGPDLDQAFKLETRQSSISNAALGLLGKTMLGNTSNRFNFDCSGVVLAALWLAGSDLRSYCAVYGGTGVERLYHLLEAHQRLSDFILPEVGDLIFWDNTYDRNGNKKWDDDLTHVGVVVGVSVDGTIRYVHHDYRRGICSAYMNLLHKDLEGFKLEDGSWYPMNSSLRMASHRYLNPQQWLSSQLFRCFGSIRGLAKDLGLPDP